MEIFLGADHRGFEDKETVKEWLEDTEHTVVDCGAEEYVSDDDYPDYALAVAEKVAEAPGERRGIVFCGSGVGAVVAANKVKGIRAGQARDPEIAAVARADDDTNLLSIGADYIEPTELIKVV